MPETLSSPPCSSTLNARGLEEFPRILTERGKVLPASKNLHLHRAFISWLGGNVFRRTRISDNILHCATIQEVRSMLADIAPHWEQTFMEKGISKGISIGEARGISIGIKNILREILTHRFGAVPNDILTSIEDISNTNDLKKLTHEAYQVGSVQAFRALLRRVTQQ